MAVIISDSNNPAYDGNWSTANAWYRVEDHNLGIDGFGGSQSLYSTNRRVQNVTFSNTGNCKGVIFPLSYGTTRVSSTISVHLQQILGVSTLDITLDTVTFASHGLANGTIVTLDTTGALPTGLNNYTPYYVVSSALNTFQLSLTLGGAAINFTGTQSGTHTVYISRAVNDTPMSSLFGTQTSSSGMWFVPFRFATPYAVDTTASKWRFWLNSTATISNQIAIMCSDYPSNTTLSYATWCDNQVTFASDDCPVFLDQVKIDASVSIKGVVAKNQAGTGHFNNLWGWVCSNNVSQTATNVIKILWPTSVAASYTLTVNGGIWLFPSYSGMQIGDSLASPLPYSKQANILYKSYLDGATTRVSSFTSRIADGFNRGGNTNLSTILFYGEVPTTRTATVASDALSGQLIINTTTSTGWSIGDTIGFTHCDTLGTLSVANSQRTIANIVGTVITVNSNLSSKIIAGATLINASRYGIKVSSDYASTTGYFGFTPANSYVSGVLWENMAVNTVAAQTNIAIASLSSLYLPDSGNYSQLIVEDCCFVGKTDSSSGFATDTIQISPLGTIIRRNHFIYAKQPTYLYPTYSSGWYSGQFLFQNNVISGATMSFLSNFSAFTSNSGLLLKNTLIDNNIFSNQTNATAGASVIVSGYGTVFQNNTFWGISGPAMCVRTSISTDCHGNTFNKCSNAYYIDNLFSSKSRVYNEVFGTTSANTSDIFVASAGFYDITFTDCTGTTTIDKTNIQQTIAGNAIKIVNKSLVTNDDIVYNTFGTIKRCGDGLSDTTVHTSGTGKFSMRFESNSGLNRLEWEQNIPTSNIQGSTMSINAWVNISNAAYYSGTHQKPRLTINYDSGTTTYAEATATTGWQLLSVPFTPSTTFGRVTATLSTMTDQTGSNAYVYFDDIGVLFPAGHQLALGGLDDWADALPVTPSIATNLSASDVWNVPVSTLTGAGTTGKQQKDLLTVGKFIALK